MKKMVWVFIISSIFLFAGKAYCENLYSDLSRRGTVKIFVSTPTDSTGKNKMSPEGLKKSIEEALTARKSVTFKVVDSKEAADIAVDIAVTEFFWSEHDPIDMIVGIGGTAMDAAMDEHYARLQADFAVNDVKSGRALWKDRLKATLTHKTMTEEESIAWINPDMAKVFITAAFGKKQSGR